MCLNVFHKAFKRKENVIGTVPAITKTNAVELLPCALHSSVKKQFYSIENIKADFNSWRYNYFLMFNFLINFPNNAIAISAIKSNFLIFNPI